MPLLNGDAAVIFDAVPQTDLKRAFSATLAQWNTPEDWENDECNIILALSRIAYTLTTGTLHPKQTLRRGWLNQFPIRNCSNCCRQQSIAI